MSTDSPARQQRIERHLIRQRGAGVRSINVNFGFAIPSCQTESSTPAREDVEPPTGRRNTLLQMTVESETTDVVKKKRKRFVAEEAIGSSADVCEDSFVFGLEKKRRRVKAATSTVPKDLDELGSTKHMVAVTEAYSNVEDDVKYAASPAEDVIHIKASPVKKQLKASQKLPGLATTTKSQADAAGEGPAPSVPVKRRTKKATISRARSGPKKETPGIDQLICTSNQATKAKARPKKTAKAVEDLQETDEPPPVASRPRRRAAIAATERVADGFVEEAAPIDKKRRDDVAQRAVKRVRKEVARPEVASVDAEPPLAAAPIPNARARKRKACVGTEDHELAEDGPLVSIQDTNVNNDCPEVIHRTTETRLTRKRAVDSDVVVQAEGQTEHIDTATQLCDPASRSRKRKVKRAQVDSVNNEDLLQDQGHTVVRATATTDPTSNTVDAGIDSTTNASQKSCAGRRDNRRIAARTGDPSVAVHDDQQSSDRTLAHADTMFRRRRSRAQLSPGTHNVASQQHRQYKPVGKPRREEDNQARMSANSLVTLTKYRQDDGATQRKHSKRVRRPLAVTDVNTSLRSISPEKIHYRSIPDSCPSPGTRNIADGAAARPGAYLTHKARGHGQRSSGRNETENGDQQTVPLNPEENSVAASEAHLTRDVIPIISEAAPSSNGARTKRSVHSAVAKISSQAQEVFNSESRSDDKMPTSEKASGFAVVGNQLATDVDEEDVGWLLEAPRQSRNHLSKSGWDPNNAAKKEARSASSGVGRIAKSRLISKLPDIDLDDLISNVNILVKNTRSA